MGTPLSKEDSDAVAGVRAAEAALNEAIRNLPPKFNASVTVVDVTSIDQPPNRDFICVNMSITV